MKPHVSRGYESTGLFTIAARAAACSAAIDGEMGWLGDYCEGTQNLGEGKESDREGYLRPSDSEPDGRVASGKERDLRR
jgi:hypothetical protein